MLVLCTGNGLSGGRSALQQAPTCGCLWGVLACLTLMQALLFVTRMANNHINCIDLALVLLRPKVS